MSSNAWLQRQRKSELLDIGKDLGLSLQESQRKADLEIAIDDYLSVNPTAHPKVKGYFSSRGRKASSPVKREPPAPLADDPPAAKPSRRRTIKPVEDAVPDSEDDGPAAAPASAAATGTSNALTATPRRVMSLASRIPLPATPADVANAVDRSSVAVREKLGELYDASGVESGTRAAREALSSVPSVILLVTLFELWFIRPEVLADRYAFTIPAISFLGTPDRAVFVPDLFLLLTASFWAPASVWALTSTILPTLAGYFVNLNVPHGGSGRGRRSAAAIAAQETAVDPLTFSIVKALLTYVVYGQRVTFGGWIDPAAVARIDGAVYGGYKGVLTGTAITALISLYDAVLRK